MMTHDALVHGEHRSWHQDNTSMLDDMAIWQAEYERALAALSRSEAVLREHGAALTEHRLALVRQERAMLEHEGDVADAQRQGVGDLVDPKQRLHDMVAKDHARHLAAHERIKLLHHRVLAEIARLSKTLESVTVG